MHIDRIDFAPADDTSSIDPTVTSVVCTLTLDDLHLIAALTGVQSGASLRELAEHTTTLDHATAEAANASLYSAAYYIQRMTGDN